MVAAIRVEGLSKRYQIAEGGERAPYGTLREDLMRLASRSLRFLGSKARNTHKELWALRNISFEIGRGEVIGVIGQNGAGKSTLLKVLGRITRPTSGRAELRGRLGSLLEVGTGFHPELTGRENIYLSGAILGMSRHEIARKFDDIVDFAEIQDFLETPVKRYSSGMYVRLGFAVAAHLEPEILLIDEVLAVGDAAFQKRCLGRMKDIASEGRTILFVSHSMATIENLCDRALWIRGGELVDQGPARRTVAGYVDSINRSTEIRRSGQYQDLGHRRGTGEVQFTAVRLLDSRGELARQFVMGESARLEADFLAADDVDYAVPVVCLKDSVTGVFVTTWYGYQQPLTLREGDKGLLTVSIPTSLLRARSYYFYLGMIGRNEQPFDIWEGAGTEFSIGYPRDVTNLPFVIGGDVGLVSLPLAAEVSRRPRGG